jgi:hypothetical protein
VYAFHDTGTSWTEYDLTLSSPSNGESYGSSISLAGSGTSIEIGAGAPLANSGNGTLYFWQWNGSSWSQSSALQGSSASSLGSSVALSANGLVCAAGAQGYAIGEGSVSIFTPSPSWIASITDFYTVPGYSEENYFGNAVALSSDGSTLVAGARLFGTPDYGTAYLLSYNGSSLSVSHTFTPFIVTADIQFGYAVATSPTADELLICSPRYRNSGGNLAGSVFVYTLHASVWSYSMLSPLDATGDFLFGSSCALTPDTSTIAIGAPGSSSLSLPAAGGVYIFRQ